KAIANSYVQQDDVQALELISALKRETRDLEQIVGYNATLTGIFARGYREHKFPRQAFIEFITDAWTTECRLSLTRAEQGQRIDSYGLFEARPSNYYPAFVDDPKAMRAQIATVMSNL